LDRYQPQCVQRDVTGLVPLAYGVLLLVLAYIAVRAIFLLVANVDIDARNVACPSGLAARTLVAMSTFCLAALMHIVAGYTYFRSRRSEPLDRSQPSPMVRVICFMSAATMPGLGIYTVAVAFFPC
jgi:hypothetical protein